MPSPRSLWVRLLWVVALLSCQGSCFQALPRPLWGPALTCSCGLARPARLLGLTTRTILFAARSVKRRRSEGLWRAVICSRCTPCKREIHPKNHGTARPAP